MSDAGEANQKNQTLAIRPADECRYDLVSLGEVMLRFDPGEGRIRTARSFQVWEGGGEYNVARGLRRCFGLRTAVVTALADNEVGRLVEDLMLQGGVDTALVRWVPYDGIGRTVRNGLNFTERGFGVRGAVGVVRPRPHRSGASFAAATSTGTTSSASSACGGCTPAESSPACRPRRRTSRSRRWRPRAATAPSCPTTSTTGPACGRRRAAASAPKRSTARWRRSST